MTKIVKIAVLILLIISASCEKDPRGYNYEQGSLRNARKSCDFNTPSTMTANSTAPSLGRLIPFCFSTRTGIAKGNDFDVIFEPMNINFDKTTGILKVTNEYANWGVYMDDYNIIRTGLNKIKTSGNEFGPNLLTAHNSNQINFFAIFNRYYRKFADKFHFE